MPHLCVSVYRVGVYLDRVQKAECSSGTMLPLAPVRACRCALELSFAYELVAAHITRELLGR